MVPVNRRICNGLAVRTVGEEKNPAIVFIHGGGQCWLSWREQLPLSEDFFVVAYDLRGHGFSDKPLEPQAYGGRALADDLHAVLCELHVERPVLCAHSYGGFTLGHSLHYYVLPGSVQVAGVVFVSAYLDGRSVCQTLPPESLSDLAALTSEQTHTHTTAVMHLIELLTEQPLRALYSDEEIAALIGSNFLLPSRVARVALGVEPDYDEQTLMRHLSQSALPTMFVQGDNDRMVSPTSTHSLAARYPQAPIRRSRCGHSPFMEQAKQFKADLAAFVRRCAFPASLRETSRRLRCFRVRA